jgi:formylglycine-generating enzyme required for sulfatase activity
MTRTIPHPLANGCGPSWASGWGQDQYGIYAEFSVPGDKESWVTQRMRWIPAGRFLMGSPKDEPGHYEDEGPQHEVILTRPFWMFDTPCTQALWQAVMGNNPSRFVDPDRPVEQVSWEEAQAFLLQVNSAVPGLNLQLPTEAMWEYACRASTNEATYAGPLKILRENNAPVLDSIAWYSGNSAVDYDLDHSKAGTRKVKTKKPNRWGLYDMLGNVWEWCDDWFDSYPVDDQTDPAGPNSGRYRVMRGGSWILVALYARSACRGRYDPGKRYFVIGFRCAQVQ